MRHRRDHSHRTPSDSAISLRERDARGEQLGEHCRHRVALVDRQLDFLRDDRRDARPRDAATGRELGVARQRHLAHAEEQARARGQSVAAPVHRRRARVCRLAVEAHDVALDSDRAADDRQRQSEILENRSLLDVQARCSRRRLRGSMRRRASSRPRRRAPRARPAGAVPSRSSSPRTASGSSEPAAALEPSIPQPKRAPSSSAQSTSLIDSAGGPAAAAARRTSSPASKPRAPSSQPPFGTESMCPPSSERPRAGAAEGHPLVAGGVKLALDAEPGQLGVEPRPRALPRLRPGKALRAVLVLTQRSQLSQVREHPRRVG